MSTELPPAPRAVFLSYASQDAEAARRICEALRAAGVEVWFDQSELRGGDSWDQKIRRQIKDCALFLPIISANTQSRREGYFRLEWKLADDRTHLMAKGTPFLVPVCVDATKDWDALVPDSFMAVQWTRLPGGETSARFTDRVVQLLDGHTTPPMPVKTRTAGRPEGDAASSGAAPARKTPWLLLAVGAAVVVSVAGYLALRPKVTAPGAVSAPIAAPTSAPAAATQFPRDPDLKRAWSLVYSLNAIAEDFALADDIVKPVLEARPNDPEVVTVAAAVAQEHVTRGFDVSDKRRSQTQRLTERAVQLAPDNPDSLASLGRYLLYLDSQLGRAEELMRRAVALNPREPRYHRTLYQIIARTKSPAETEALAAQMVAQFPKDPLVAYDIARHYKDSDQLARMEEWFDKTLALAPLTYALTWKAWIMLEVHGDVAGMKAWLDRVPERERTTTRVVNAFAVHAGITGQTGPAQDLLRALADPWLTDFDFTGPKALLVGDLLSVEGRSELARLQYESALAEIQRAVARDSTDLRPRRAEVWTLLGLGRRDEARVALRLVTQALPRPYRFGMRNSWWSGPIRAALLLGERDQALTLLRETCADAQSRMLLRTQVRADPRMAPFRDDPEIAALLADAPKPKTGDSGQAAVKIDEKSVAVLAFANLSDDKANEYFSDGISEELLNVLAKVPGLKVTARTSAFSFKGKDTPIPEIARQLSVAYVVEGSVRRQGDKVRITAQLIKAADGFRAWSDTFTRELKDVFAVQDEIAGLIAKSLSVRLGTGSSPAAPVDPRAFELYVQARQAWSSRSFENFARAEQLLIRALEFDPGFVRGRAALIDVRQMRAFRQGVIGNFDQRNAPELERYLGEVREVLAVDPGLAEAYATMGTTLQGQWKTAEALQTYRQAVALNPNYATGHQWLGMQLLMEGRVDEALAELKLATELDPLSAIILDNYGWLLNHAGRHTEALAMLDRAIALNPGFSQTSAMKASSLWALGRTDEAVTLARQIKYFDLDEQVRTFVTVGLTAELGGLLSGAESRQKFSLSKPLLAAGRTEEALSLLSNAVGVTFGDCVEVLYRPLYDPARHDPRFVQFIAKLGLSEAHARAQAWRKAHPPEKVETRK